MATERTCESPPPPPGMGNINTNTITHNNTISDSRLQAETQNLIHAVHNVHISGGKISNSNFPTNRNQFDKRIIDWCSEDPEESTDAKNIDFPLQTSEHKSNKNCTRNLSNHEAPNENFYDDVEVLPPQRIYTPPNPIGETRYSTPSFAPADRGNSAESNNSDNFEFNSKCTECILEVDLCSLGRGYVLKPVASNRLCMLSKLMTKRRELIGKNAPTFSPTKLMDGLDIGNIGVHVYRQEQMNQMRARLSKPADSSTSSLSSHPNQLEGGAPQVNQPFVPSHRFTLRFGSPLQCTKGMALLTQLGLSPHYPSPPRIRGKVFGFHFLDENKDISALLQEYAWFIGGAPSLVLTRELHRQQEGLYCDDCQFSVFASEFNNILQIPSPHSGRPLKWMPYKGPKIVFCTHCNKQDNHFRKSCPKLAQSNSVQGIRDACVMCGSFEHVVADCPDMKKENVVCSICKKGKHTVRACPMTRGSYAKVLVGADDTTGLLKTKWTWNNGTMTAAQRMAADQQQQQRQQFQQRQQQQASDKPMFIAHQARPENEHYQAEISRMKNEISRLTKSVESIAQANIDMKELMNSLIQANQALTQQVTILVNNTNNMLMGHAPSVQPAPMMSAPAPSRNTIKRAQPRNPINQTKLNNYYSSLSQANQAEARQAYNTLTRDGRKQTAESEYDQDELDTDQEQGQLDTEDEHDENDDTEHHQYEQQQYQQQTTSKPNVRARAKRRQDHSVRATPTTPVTSTARASNNAPPTSAVVLSQRMNGPTANKKARK